MTTVHQNNDSSPVEKYINIAVPETFKLAIDQAVLDNKKAGSGPVTLRDYCIEALADKLGIPVPGDQSQAKEPESKRRKAS